MRRSSALLALLAAALMAGWFFTLGPASLGGPVTYVMVRGGSMEPALYDGDLAVVRKEQSYSAGDIAAFAVEGGVVIHRIVGGTAEGGFLTQGDNTSSPDAWRPTGEDVVGRLWFSIPAGGQFLAFLLQPLILGSLAGGLGVLTVLSGGPGKPPPRSGTPPSRPADANRGDPRGTRLIVGLVLAVGLTGAVGLLRKKDRGTLS